MKFWFIMLCHTLLIPAIMVLCGILMRKYPPKKSNSIYGYRTHRSGRSPETWKFANAYCAALYEKIGWYTLAVPVVVMLFMWGKEESAISMVSTVLVTLQCVGLLIPIFYTERALKEKFGD